jgi:hypothetical protein
MPLLISLFSHSSTSIQARTEKASQANNIAFRCVGESLRLHSDFSVHAPTD